MLCRATPVHILRANELRNEPSSVASHRQFQVSEGPEQVTLAKWFVICRGRKFPACSAMGDPACCVASGGGAQVEKIALRHNSLASFTNCKSMFDGAQGSIGSLSFGRLGWRFHCYRTPVQPCVSLLKLKGQRAGLPNLHLRVLQRSKVGTLRGIRTQTAQYTEIEDNT